jgi:hypothetical protein
MSAKRSPCTMKMTLFREALLQVDNFTQLSFFQIFRWSFSKQRFCCHRQCSGERHKARA